jgi:hypothetical protein
MAEPKKLKRYGQGMETVTDAEQMFTVVIRLPRSKQSTRGRAEYRRTLRRVIEKCEGLLK